MNSRKGSTNSDDAEANAPNENDLSHNPYKGHELQEEGEKVLAAQQGKLSKYEKERRAAERKRKQDQQEADETVARESQYFGAVPANAPPITSQRQQPGGRAIDQMRRMMAKPGDTVPEARKKEWGHGLYPTLSIEGVPPAAPFQLVKQRCSPEFQRNIVDSCPIKGSGEHDKEVHEIDREDIVILGFLVVLRATTGEDKVKAFIKELDGVYLGWGYKLGVTRHLSSSTPRASQIDLPRLKTKLPWRARVPERIDQGHLNPPVAGRQHLVIDLNRYIPMETLRAIHHIVEQLLEHEANLEQFEVKLFEETSMDEKFRWLHDDTTLEHGYYSWLLAHGFGDDEAEERRQFALGPDDSDYKYHRLEADVPWDIIPPFKQVHYQYLDGVEKINDDPSHKTAAVDAYDAEGVVDRFAGLHLDPVQKAEFHDLLLSLPTNMTKIGGAYRGFAPLTEFAVQLAVRDPKDVVELYCLNVSAPVRLMQGFTDAVPFMERSFEEQCKNLETGDKLEDARLVGLMAISDLMTHVINNQIRGGANRYPEMFFECFKEYGTFYELGCTLCRGEMGTMAFTRYVRKVKNLLRSWAGEGQFVVIFSRAKVEEMGAEFKRGVDEVQEIHDADWDEW